MTSVELADHVKVTVNEDTAQLSLATTADSGQRAADMANAVSKEIASSVARYSAQGAGGVLKADIVRPGQVPSSPASPNLLRNLGVAIALGLAFAMAQALIRWRLDSRLTTASDVTKAIPDVPVVGELPWDRGLERHGVHFGDDTFAPRVEALRRLRTNMQFISAAGDKAPWLITSSVPGEGKTATAIGIAKAFADAGQRVLLIDADLRRPQVANALGLIGEAGLTTTLSGDASLTEVVQPSQGFDVLTSGAIPPNPTELLGTPQMSRLLQALSANYDAVIVDSPPVLPVADAAVMSRSVGPVLVVASSGTVKRGQLQKTIKSLKAVDARVTGLVLNKIKTAGEEGYGYKYSYRYQPKVTPQKTPRVKQPQTR